MQITQNLPVTEGMLRTSQISGGWWRRFLEHNIGTSLRAGDATAGIRIDAINEGNMRKHFDPLDDVYTELDFKDHLERIDNIV